MQTVTRAISMASTTAVGSLAAGTASLMDPWSAASPSARWHRPVWTRTPGSPNFTLPRSAFTLTYPRWVATDVAVFGVFGLAWLAATFAIVERRRPSADADGPPG